jgi:hypothetical protein
MDFTDFYACVLKSGQFIRRDRIDAFGQLADQDVICYLHARYDHMYETDAGYKTPYYQFSFVNKEGGSTSFGCGDFEIVFIDTDWGFSRNYAVGRNITIRNCRTNQYYEYRSYEVYSKFIPDELIPLFQKLNQCGSEEEIRMALKSHQPYSALQQSFDSLTKKAKKLQEQVDALLSKIESIKKMIADI